MNITTSGTRPAIRFDRNELSGAFGDMGTDVPLIIGVALASHLDGASVLIMFGAMQILTGLAYRMPMPVQPLKAMAAIVMRRSAEHTSELQSLTQIVCRLLLANKTATQDTSSSALMREHR